MTYDPAETRSILNGAMTALKSGDRVTALRLARRAVALSPETDEPWLVLAAVSSADRSLVYVKKALEINPESKAAQMALEWARNRPGALPPAQAGQQETYPRNSPEDLTEEPAAEPAQASPQATETALPFETIRAASSLDGEVATPANPLRQRIKSWSTLMRPFRYYLLGLLVVVLVVEIASIWLMLSASPAVSAAQPACSPSLVIGKLYMRIEHLKPGPNGSLHTPSSYLYRAYWVEGTLANPMFLVSFAPDNPSLVASFKAGEKATITWANCTTASYSLSAPTTGSLDSATRSQQAAQLIIFFPTLIETSGFVLHGELQKEGY